MCGFDVQRWRDKLFAREGPRYSSLLFLVEPSFKPRLPYGCCLGQLWLLHLCCLSVFMVVPLVTTPPVTPKGPIPNWLVLVISSPGKGHRYRLHSCVSTLVILEPKAISLRRIPVSGIKQQTVQPSSLAL